MGLPVWKLGLLMLVPLASAYGVRRLVQPRFVDAVPPKSQSGRQFRMDFFLFILTGFATATYAWLDLGFPFIGSGMKVVVGLTAIGLFAGIDLALERERVVIREDSAGEDARMPPKRLYPMTRRFSLVAVGIMALFTVVMLLVIHNNLTWLAGEGDTAGMLTSVLRDVVVVMGVLVVLMINLVVSYSRNLRLLFTNQTVVLEAVSRGDLGGHVPVMTEDEFGVIAGHTNTMILGLRDRLRLAEGVQLAQEVQQTLLPAAAPEVAGLDIAGTSRYSDETGGDYYDFIFSPDKKRLEIVVGDVTGHGLEAALLMASTRAFIRQRSALPGSMSQSLEDVNRMVVKDTFGTGRFITLFTLSVDVTTRELLYASAGHDPALVYHPGQDAFVELGCAGLPLGVTGETEYEQCSRQALTEGEIVLVGTDGIWEATNSRGELFGKTRLREVIRAHARDEAGRIVEAIVDAVAQHRGETPQVDDLTMVVVKAL